MTTLHKKRVFVGSSTLGLEKAREICSLISDQHTEAVLWTTVFEPGYVTIEGLEKVLSECSAAVLVATPDDETIIQDKIIKTPRANVMLEFGLLAGRLGRHNIAICLYPTTELPSDLKGLTVIEMEPAASAESSGEAQIAAPLRRSPETALRAWSSKALATAKQVERTKIVHGYTGVWDFDVILRQWRGIALSPGSYATGSGKAHLYVDATGSSGTGAVHGTLSVKLGAEASSDAGIFSCELRFSHEIVRAACGDQGDLQLTTRIFALAAKAASGRPPSQMGTLEDPPSPWPFQWNLIPGDEPRTLHGVIEAMAPGTTRGSIRFTKSASGPCQ